MTQESANEHHSTITVGGEGASPNIDVAEDKSLTETIASIPELVNKEDVARMIDIQVNAIDRLEGINKSLVNCNQMAQSKLSTTTKLFKKTAKQMSEAKKDLDFIYQKILMMKNKIHAETQQAEIEQRQNNIPNCDENE